MSDEAVISRRQQPLLDLGPLVIGLAFLIDHDCAIYIWNDLDFTYNDVLLAVELEATQLNIILPFPSTVGIVAHKQ
ncbi:hypothetical protein SprV_0401496200 [Sparganum proliferum]